MPILMMDQNHAIKTLTPEQLFGYIQSGGVGGEIGGVASAYRRVPRFYRCVNLIVESACSVPAYIDDTPIKEVWDKRTPFLALLQETITDLVLHGSAYWLPLKNAYGDTLAFQILRADTMTVMLDRVEDGQVIRKFQQNVEGQIYPRSNGGWWDEEDLIYFCLYNPSSQVQDGVAPAEVALSSAKIFHYLDTFTSKYFQEGALNVWLLSVKNSNLKDPDKDRLRDFFRKTLQGLKRAFTVEVINGDFQAQQLSSDMDTLDIEKRKADARKDIADAFGVPDAVIESGSWDGTSQIQQRSFYESTVQRYLTTIVMTLEAIGINIRFDMQELAIFQEDEQKRSTSLMQLVSAGVPLPIAWLTLGFDMPEGHTEAELLPAPQANPMPNPQVILRDQMNPDGNEMPLKMVESTATQVKKSCHHGHDCNCGELVRYKKKALRLFSEGVKTVDFTSDTLPAVQIAYIKSALEVMTDPDEIREFFDAEIRLEDYPMVHYA